MWEDGTAQAEGAVKYSKSVFDPSFNKKNKNKKNNLSIAELIMVTMHSQKKGTKALTGAMPYQKVLFKY